MEVYNSKKVPWKMLRKVWEINFISKISNLRCSLEVHPQEESDWDGEFVGILEQ